MTGRDKDNDEGTDEWPSISSRKGETVWSSKQEKEGSLSFDFDETVGWISPNADWVDVPVSDVPELRRWIFKSPKQLRQEDSPSYSQADEVTEFENLTEVRKAIVYYVAQNPLADKQTIAEETGTPASTVNNVLRRHRDIIVQTMIEGVPEDYVYAPNKWTSATVEQLRAKKPDPETPMDAAEDYEALSKKRQRAVDLLTVFPDVGYNDIPVEPGISESIFKHTKQHHLDIVKKRYEELELSPELLEDMDIGGVDQRFTTDSGMSVHEITESLTGAFATDMTEDENTDSDEDEQAEEEPEMSDYLGDEIEVQTGPIEESDTDGSRGVPRELQEDIVRMLGQAPMSHTGRTEGVHVVGVGIPDTTEAKVKAISVTATILMFTLLGVYTSIKKVYKVAR